LKEFATVHASGSLIQAPHLAFRQDPKIARTADPDARFGTDTRSPPLTRNTIKPVARSGSSSKRLAAQDFGLLLGIVNLIG